MGFLRRIFGGGGRANEPGPARPAPDSPPPAPEPEIADLAPEQVVTLLEATPDLQILDVRFAHEHRLHHVAGAVLIPTPELMDRIAELDARRPTLVYCEHGMRSLSACGVLAQAGFARIFNMAGGMADYSAAAGAAGWPAERRIVRI